MGPDSSNFHSVFIIKNCNVLTIDQSFFKLLLVYIDIIELHSFQMHCTSFKKSYFVNFVHTYVFLFLLKIKICFYSVYS